MADIFVIVRTPSFLPWPVVVSSFSITIGCHSLSEGYRRYLNFKTSKQLPRRQRQQPSQLNMVSFSDEILPNPRQGIGARQTFGPNVGFKFDMRERKTSVLPQCKVEGLAWWG